MKRVNARLCILLALLTMVPATGLAAIPPTPPPRPNPLAGQIKDVHDAELNVAAAKKQLLVIRKRVEVTFHVKAEWKAAKAALDKAKGDYDAAIKKMNETLARKPEYIALVDKRDKAQAILDQASHPLPVASGDDPVKLTDEQVQQASKDRTESGLALREMQKNAEDSDPTIIPVRQKYTDARAAWDALELQVDEAMKTDPGYPQAQQAVDQAEARLKQSREALQSAQAAQHPVRPPGSGSNPFLPR